MSSSAASTIRPSNPCSRSASAALAPARPPPAMTNVSEAGIVSLLSCAEGGGEPLSEVVPAGVERGHALVFQSLDDLAVVDAERGKVIEDGLRLLVGAVDAVVRDRPVVGDRVECGLGRGVDHVGCDQPGDVPGVVVGGVLDAGGGPQRTLQPGPGAFQRLPPGGGERL